MREGRTGQNLGIFFSHAYRQMRLAPPASSSAVMLEPIMAMRAITFFTANPPYQRELPPAPLTADEVTLRFEALQPP